jgi:tRNA A-37 threonylcarbamoyl transferase component Bud32/membrane-associated phospholipid phosphatase
MTDQSEGAQSGWTLEFHLCSRLGRKTQDVVTAGIVEDLTVEGEEQDLARARRHGVAVPSRRIRPRRRRRPSGEPPPLVRNLQKSGRFLLLVAGFVLLLLLLVALVGDLGSRLDRIDSAILQGFSELRSPTLTTAARGIDAVLGSAFVLGILAWAAIVALILLRRFRHLFVFIGSVLTVGFLTTGISLIFVRARPVGLTILGHWQGASLPSRPVALLAVTAMGLSYTMITAGGARDIAKRASQVLVLTLGLSRLYLAVDHPTDVIMGAILGFAIPVIAFRMLVPNEAFPVTYRRGRSAHLDVGGERGEAIRRALREQLGISVIAMKPFGLAGSGGSTPLRLEIAGERPTYLFAKLYAATHLRADRWYKLGRMLLYGRLEDEASFSTVRRLVQYEDYMLLAMGKAGLPVAEPYGFVEIAPEREYLIVTEFIDGATELLEADVDDRIIDDALKVVRQLWDAGFAHRDIKPSNLLVRDGRVRIIDVAFGEVRPSPWRQAVDLANMMLILALRSNPEHIYGRALKFFSSSDIAEAFSATRSVTMPSQSRSMLRKDRRDLVARFRELAPRRARISIQRWSWRRVALTVGVLVSAVVGSQVAVINLSGGGVLGGLRGSSGSYAVVTKAPECDRGSGEQLVLEAQSVLSASLVPCVEALPPGWRFHTLLVRDGSSRLTLLSDRTGTRSVEVTLTRRCDVSEATSTPSDHDGARRYDAADIRAGRYSEIRYYVFPGGCVSQRFRLPTGPEEIASVAASKLALALDFETHRTVAADYFKETGLRL